MIQERKDTFLRLARNSPKSPRKIRLNVLQNLSQNQNLTTAQEACELRLGPYEWVVGNLVTQRFGTLRSQQEM